MVVIKFLRERHIVGVCNLQVCISPITCEDGEKTAMGYCPKVLYHSIMIS